jgi:ZIP family zinc transporter
LLFMYFLDRVVPHVHPGLCSDEHGSKLNKTALYLFLGIFLHHFPEGMAMGIGLVSGVTATLSVALAIALHDVPEGICTSAPYYFLSGKRLKAFILSSLTALPTLAGFLFTYFLSAYIPKPVVGLLIAGTAGLMIYISADELIPFSCSVSSEHKSIFSFFAGVLFVTLLAYY